MSAARDGDGNLVVADGRAGEVRVFDGRGRHLRTLGRKGEGPGEFQVLTGAWPVPGGGVVAVDRVQRRIVRFDAEGSLVAAGRFAGVGGIGALTTVGISGSERFLSQIMDMGMHGESSIQDLEETIGDGAERVLFVRHGLDGALVDTLAGRRGPRMSLSTSGSGEAMTVQVMAVPFSVHPAATGSPHGIAVTGGARRRD